MYRQNKPYAASRLDMVIIGESIASWVTSVEIFPGYKSDHSRVQMEFNMYNIQRGQGVWKLNNRLLSEQEYVLGVKKVIKQVKDSMYLDPDERFEMAKLESIQYSKEYAKQRAQTRKLIINQLEENLKRLTEELDEHKIERNALYVRTKCDLEELVEEKTRGAAFRSRCQWYNKAGKPTKYFLNLEKNRAGSKNVPVVIKENGEKLEDIKEILSEQNRFYTELYRSDPNVRFHCTIEKVPQLSEVSKVAMDSEIMLEELKASLKQCKRGVSLGTDGLTYEFYIMFFQDLGDMLLDAIKYCFARKRLFRSARQGIINTIPKKNKDGRFLKHLRPITLLNSDFKLIEKVMANRIKPRLMELIHSDQKGFLPSRRISSNIRCILDIMDMLNQERQEGVVISVDYEKCFDRLEKVAILETMKMFNFGPNIISWADTMYTDMTVKIFNNGFLSDLIKVTRGCRQGAPCSPYYFLLCAELLAIKFRENDSIEGFDLNSFRKLFGQYADDLDIYCKPTQQNIDQIQTTLASFCQATGCKVNYDKTTIYRIGPDNRALANIFTRNMRVEQSAINVLGVWIAQDEEEMMRLNYAPIVDKIRGILLNWKNRQLDLIAKVTVVNSLIASLLVYKMYILPNLTKATVKRLDKIVEDFIWDGRKPKIPLKKLQNKAKGGLGLVDFEIKEAALKVSWVHYLNMGTDLFMNEMAYCNLSPILREQIWMCNINESDICKIKNNNEFWVQVWATWLKFYYTEDRTTDQCIWYNSHIRIQSKPVMWKKPFRKGLCTINQIYDDGKFVSFEHTEEEYGLTVMQFNALKAAIKKGNFVKGDQRQKEKLEHYYATSKPVRLYYITCATRNDLQFNTYIQWQVRLQSNILYDDFLQLFALVNVVTNSTKLRSFQYRLLNLAIVLNIQLYQWKIMSDEMCYYCKTEKETLEHIFFHCPNATKLHNSIS